MKRGEDYGMRGRHENFVDSRPRDYDSVCEDEHADEKPNRYSFFCCGHICSYQNTMFKITKMMATIVAQKIGR